MWVDICLLLAVVGLLIMSILDFRMISRLRSQMVERGVNIRSDFSQMTKRLFSRRRNRCFTCRRRFHEDDLYIVWDSYVETEFHYCAECFSE